MRCSPMRWYSLFVAGAREGTAPLNGRSVGVAPDTRAQRVSPCGRKSCNTSQKKKATGGKVLILLRLGNVSELFAKPKPLKYFDCKKITHKVKKAIELPPKKTNVEKDILGVRFAI